MRNTGRLPQRHQLRRSVCFFLSLVALNTSLISQASAQANSSSGPHLYFVTNHGCAPCALVEPEIEVLNKEGYPVTTVYFNQHPQWATQMGVDRTPTVLMVSNKQIVRKQSGYIDAVTLKQWFASAGMRSGAAFTKPDGTPTGGTKVSIDRPSTKFPRVDQGAGGKLPPVKMVPTRTMHQGTTQPSNDQEALAMQATVRLRVEDPEGTSFATGTVIHSRKGEALVATCGHVFRDSQGTGTITAEYGFDTGQIIKVPGELIAYDSDARDIGLVAIKTPQEIKPVKIATKGLDIARGSTIFSIGCDHGEPPTIRHSQIKNKAAYDGSIKYDIFGRPVDGRSGGGLFNRDGELIGVCNAAAVEVDEGIYTALETIYWQLDQANLAGLFDNRASAVAQNTQPRQSSPNPQPRQDLAIRTPQVPRSPIRDVPKTNPRTNAAWNRDNGGATSSDDMEVIIIVRSKTNPEHAEAITVTNPSPELLNCLQDMQASKSSVRQLEVASLRQIKKSVKASGQKFSSHRLSPINR